MKAGLYDNARWLAIQAHKEQRRKFSKEPYVEHPIRVAERVRQGRQSDEAVAAALLHDVWKTPP